MEASANNKTDAEINSEPADPKTVSKAATVNAAPVLPCASAPLERMATAVIVQTTIVSTKTSKTLLMPCLIQDLSQWKELKIS